MKRSLFEITRLVSHPGISSRCAWHLNNLDKFPKTVDTPLKLY